MGSGFDEVLGNFERSRGCFGGVGGKERVGGVGLCCDVSQIAQGVAAVAWDPV